MNKPLNPGVTFFLPTIQARRKQSVQKKELNQRETLKPSLIEGGEA
jgi:hypothetical protein